MRDHVRVHNCTFCHVLSGYAGTDPVALAVALSSGTAGLYSFSFGTYAILGTLTVGRCQQLVVTGKFAPAGQRAL
jgi:hypothetical protein